MLILNTRNTSDSVHWQFRSQRFYNNLNSVNENSGILDIWLVIMIFDRWPRERRQHYFTLDDGRIINCIGGGCGLYGGWRLARCEPT